MEICRCIPDAAIDILVLLKNSSSCVRSEVLRLWQLIVVQHLAPTYLLVTDAHEAGVLIIAEFVVSLNQ